MLSPQLIEEKRIFLFHGQDTRQEAEITFQYINDSGLKNGGGWFFNKCVFKTLSNSYNFEDWLFLGDISAKINKLLRDLNK